MKTIFITGISSGIGKAAAVAFLKRGDCVIGTVRDENSIMDLTQQFPQQFIVLKIDLKNLNEIDRLPDFLKLKKIDKIDILINNAGVATAAPFEFQNFSEIQEMIQLNVLSLMRVTQVLISYIKKSKDGRIINISSVAGQNGTPFLAGYSASKHAVEGFSESLRRELNLYGVKVILIGPGSVKTPIWKKGFESVKHIYQDTAYAQSFEKFIKMALGSEEKGLTVERIVEDIFSASFSKYPKMRYSPVPQKWINQTLPQLLPKAMVDCLTCWVLKLRKPVI